MTRGMVRCKVFSSGSAASLECDINEWCEGMETDLNYSTGFVSTHYSSSFLGGDVRVPFPKNFTALIFFKRRLKTEEEKAAEKKMMEEG